MIRALLLAVSLLPAGAGAGQSVTIVVDKYAFSQPELTVSAGTTIEWVNKDDTPHNVAAVAGGFRSPPLDTGDSWKHRFDTPGIYAYFCQLHPHMTGSVTVTPAGSP